MPKGLIVIRWDDKLGAIVEAKHPPDLQVRDDHVMRIFTTHTLGDAAQGFLSMKIEDLNVASYYSGVLKSDAGQFCISLILEKDEDPEVFEEILVETALTILEKFRTPTFYDEIVKEYEKITKTPVVETEQRLALIFSDPIRLAILSKLTEGSLTRKELVEWLKEQKNIDIPDLNATLAPFIKTGLVRTSFVEGITDECVFLVKDVFALRSPVKELILKSKKGGFNPSISDSYLQEVERFFSTYKSTQEDISNLSSLIIDPDTYYLLSKLRENPILKKELYANSKLSENRINELVSKLEENHLIRIIPDSNGDEWLCLISHILFVQFFPEYLIDVIRQKWNEGLIDQRQAIRHLELLMESYE
ncbi:MAG: hypothetical protein OdinLCB4_001135 [Candidatus Odinarchaeum yellowstonii]|uniref:Uncharacterized protein n=1 Tax=Odinarchaeota yellowstonii (strain LCB_4) TaxID=1841599 RepID=A0AAF0D2R8_ODILC|nr:MAG: hypothetical protein OdinLCB4_001135 [Candidatus Odinarchaeum yellowstonii]